MAVNLGFELYYKAVNYNRQIINQMVEDKNDIGISTLRRRSTKPIINHSVTLVLTKPEYLILEDNVNKKLLGGIVPFYFKDFLTAIQRVGRFKTEKGAWFTNYEQTNVNIKISVNIEECEA